MMLTQLYHNILFGSMTLHYQVSLHLTISPHDGHSIMSHYTAPITSHPINLWWLHSYTIMFYWLHGYQVWLGVEIRHSTR